MRKNLDGASMLYQEQGRSDYQAQLALLRDRLKEYIFAQQKSRSTSGFSYIWAILDCYGDISALPNGYGGCWHLVSVAQLQLTLPSPLLGIKNAAAPTGGAVAHACGL